MKLELGFIKINDVQFSNECAVKDGILYVNPEEVKEYVYDYDDVKQFVKSISFDIAKPGESVRITPVKDVIEPRVKVEGPGAADWGTFQDLRGYRGFQTPWSRRGSRCGRAHR